MTTEKILNYEKSKLLNPKLFEVYGDTILEGIKLLDGIKENSNYLKFVGYNLDNLESPIYIFKQNNSKNHVAVKICGRYQDWDITEEIKSLIGGIDKPDFVIVDSDTGAIILAGETTETIPLGNSELQRKGRVIVAAKKKIPFLYKCPGTHFDDSKLSSSKRAEGNRGQARYLMPISVLMHFILSIRYKVPSLLFIEPNKEADKILNFKVDKDTKMYFYDYISSLLLLNNSENQNLKKETEKKIFKSLILYLKNNINNNVLIEKIKIEPIFSTLTKKLNLFFDKFIEYINNKDIKKIDDILKITNWSYETFPKWQNGFLSGPKGPRNRKNWLFKKLMSQKLIKSFSYQANTSRPGIVTETSKLIELISYNTDININDLKKKLKLNLPTLIIPTLAYQWLDEERIIPKKEPGTGEICHYSEFFAFHERNEKILNILIYIYIKSPPNGISTNNSLFNAIKMYSDCLIIDDKIYELN